MPRSASVPSYRFHKPSGQAVVTVRTAEGGRRDVYLGTFNSPESRVEYARVIAEASSAPVVTSVTGQLTIDQLLVAFMRHAEAQYRRADGKPSSAVGEYKAAARPLHKLYGHTRAAAFGPIALKTVRQELLAGGVCRKTVNARVGKLRRIFKWGVENELVPVTTFTALQTVAGLQAGRTEAPDHDPVEPVGDEVVNATLPHLNRHVRGLVQFQRLTGCRPSEAAGVRRCDIDETGEVWLYTPVSHKTKHKGKSRVIAIGGRAQEVLKEFFTGDPHDYLFSPRRAVEERNAAARAGRRTPLTPAQRARRPRANPKRKPGERYTRQAYLNAVVRACDRAGVAHWSPYQLRHAFATAVRKRHGLEAAQVACGHARADVTQVYTARDLALAAKVAAEIG